MPNSREKRSTKGLYDDNENLHNDGKDFHSSNNAAVVIKPLKKKQKTKKPHLYEDKVLQLLLLFCSLNNCAKMCEILNQKLPLIFFFSKISKTRIQSTVLVSILILLSVGLVLQIRNVCVPLCWMRSVTCGNVP